MSVLTDHSRLQSNSRYNGVDNMHPITYIANQKTGGVCLGTSAVSGHYAVA